MDLISFLQQCDLALPHKSSFPPPESLIGTLKTDSRSIELGDVYLAMPVEQEDLAKKYRAEAQERGAAYILDVPEPRQLWSQWAKYCFPLQPQTCVAVTGTNGKTSTVEFTRQLWQLSGLKAASIGTLGINAEGISDQDQWPEVKLTTPDAFILHKALHQLAGEDIQHVALEASSHGLNQNRLDQVNWAAAAFTNLSHEHLDYHKTMEAYFQSKARLFQDGLSTSSVAVLNREDPYGQRLGRLCNERGIRMLWFGGKEADIEIEKADKHSKGISLALNILGKKVALDLPLIGLFQIENVLTALGLVIGTGLNVNQALQGLPQLKGVPGRMEYVGETFEGGAVYVDYAHKALALENILKEARAHASGKVLLVFGCGGNRDTEKRSMMGKIAQKYADEIYVTDDNPRDEDPGLIRAAILKECPKAFEVSPRDEAIARALSKCKRGDICIIAGKGHEVGQIVKDKVIPFDDRRVAQQFLMPMS